MQPGAQGEGEREGVPLLGSIWVFVSLAGVAAAMTSVFLGMRSVMEIGGACAEGGPFVPVRTCPSGVPAVLIGGIWLGLIFAGLYVWQGFRHGVPSLAGLLWPALFLSLGWNFLQFGLDSPVGGGLEWGWIVCAVVFIAMGGVPLVAVLPFIWRRLTGRAPTSRLGGMLLPRRARVAASGSASPGWVGWNVPASGAAPDPSTAAAWPGSTTPETTQTDDLVRALERLDALHRSGALDDAEYDAAKRRILGSEGS